MKYDTFLGSLIEFLAEKPLISFPQNILFTNYTGPCTNLRAAGISAVSLLFSSQATDAKPLVHVVWLWSPRNSLNHSFPPFLAHYLDAVRGKIFLTSCVREKYCKRKICMWERKGQWGFLFFPFPFGILKCNIVRFML